ncbi:MAG: DUF4190 domain-containing protein [Nanoarchaeota archaeon]|nr:DUF4190 domain-containing protein [Nanoarchaeota archaeon]
MKELSWEAIASLVFGIFAVFGRILFIIFDNIPFRSLEEISISVHFFSIIFAILFGIIALIKSRNVKKVNEKTFAIIGIVLGVIGFLELTYFGVLPHEQMRPEKCIMETGISCLDHKIDSKNNEISLLLQNRKGKGIIITNISVKGKDIYGHCYADTGEWESPQSYQQNAYGPPWTDPTIGNFEGKIGLHIPNGESLVIPIKCGTVIPGEIRDTDDHTRGEITLTWYFDDSNKTYSSMMEGEISARVWT